MTNASTVVVGGRVVGWPEPHSEDAFRGGTPVPREKGKNPSRSCDRHHPLRYQLNSTESENATFLSVCVASLVCFGRSQPRPALAPIQRCTHQSNGGSNVVTICYRSHVCPAPYVSFLRKDPGADGARRFASHGLDDCRNGPGTMRRQNIG